MSVERWTECEPCYGNGCSACGFKGRFETEEYRDAKADADERRADEARHRRIFGDD